MLFRSRFWHKFLYDIGVVPTKEPFQKLFNQGMILGTSYRDHRGALVATDKVEKRDGSFFHVETGEELEQVPAKMSKFLKNIVNPDDVVEQYGADTLRISKSRDWKTSASTLKAASASRRSDSQDTIAPVSRTLKDTMKQNQELFMVFHRC